MVNVPIDIPLTNISVAAFQSGEGYVASRIFPMVPVTEQSGQYYVFDESDLNRDTAQRRADAAESAGDTYTLADDNFRCEVFALHKDVGDQLVANYGRIPGTPHASAARFIAGKMLLKQETEFAKAYLQPDVWANDLTGTNTGAGANEFVQFSNDAISPVDTIEDLKSLISDRTGIEPNVLTLGGKAYRALKRHPEIREQFKYTTSENITAEILANVLEIERLVVSKGIVNTAAKGKGVSNERIFDNGLLLAYAAPNPGIEVPTAGYGFHWTAVSEGMGEAIGTYQFPLPNLRADRVESQIAFDFKVVAPTLGVFVDNVTA